ncbi:adhesin, partial [Burkholderia cenocepacia]|uniref:ESPR-type extended signal peptide-containing protein n=1 Tax=Burkholderia cenocepacia TaxID=95486 RepID=UPI000F59CD98
MNKSYRTVWNATTGTWAAAPETARMRTKSKSNATMKSSVTAAVAVMTGVGGGAVSLDAMAQAANGNGSLVLCGPTSGPVYGESFGSGSATGTRLTGGCIANPSRISQNREIAFQLYNHSNGAGGGVGQPSAATEAGISGSKNGHLVLLGGSGVHIVGPADFDNNVNMTNHQVKNLAAGTAGTDAVNLNQLNSAIAAAKTAPNPYVATSTGLYAAATAARAGSSATAVGANANASGTSAVALGGNTVAAGQNAVALGTLANATANETVAVGVSARATGNNATAMGRSAVAAGSGSLALGSASQVDTASSIAVGANARVITGGVTGANSSIAIGNGAVAGGTNSIVIGTNAQHSGSGATVLGSNASAMGGSMGVAVGYNSSAAGASAVSVGTNAMASGRNSVAMGLEASATAINSVVVGYGATGAGETSTVMGTGARATGYHAVSLGANANSAGRDSVALGTNANAANTNSVALGNQSIANRDNSVSVGSSTLQRQITNVAAGTQGTDAVNLNQLNTAIANVSTGANPYVAVRGTTAANATGSRSIAIGDGAFAANSYGAGSGGDTNIAIGANARTTGGFGEMALGEGAAVTGQAVGATAIGRGATAQANQSVALGDGAMADRANTVSVGSAARQRQITNVAAGTQDTDAVNVSQLKGAGLIGDDGKAIAAVTYDRHADGTPNYGSVTLGNGNGPTQIKNVADATDDHDALNLGQLKDTGLVGDDGTGKLTSLAVTYDDATKGKATLAGVDGTTLSNVKAGAADMDAVNVSQLKGSGLIGDDGKSIAAVTYDRNADGTPNYGTVTLGHGEGPTQIKSVADATDDHDALNLGQLKDAGLVGDDGAGKLTSLAVTYDDASKDKVTLAGADGTTLSNVKAGVADMDAVNVSQLKDSGLIGDDGKAIAAVTYDGASKDKVTLAGADGTTLSNVKAGVADMDAVNVSQLKDSGLIGDDGKAIAAVTYDGAAKDKVTLAGTDGTTLSNVKAGVADMDAVNVSQLKDSGLIGDDGKAIAAVTYDSAAKDSVTLGGVGSTTPVALHNVADGVLSATSKDAVNGSQLFATNTRVGDLEDSLSKGGVIDPVTGESLAVVYDSNAKDTVTLKGADGTTLSNVKAGAADMDAVNVSQLKGSGLIGDDGKSIAAVTYDRNADGTPNYGTVTLGHGEGPTQIKNVATGVDDLDAVNVKQLNTGLSDLRDEMSGGNLRFVKVNADPVTGTPAVASGALAVAIGSDARATSANSLALGSGARVTGTGSVAIGYNSVANQNNVVSVGDVGRERKIVNVADGDVAFQSTDAVNGGQLYAALNNLSTSVTSKTQQAIDTFSSEIDKKTQAAIDEVNSHSMQPMDVSDPLVAIEGLKGNNVASLNGADPTQATAAAIGSSTAASGANAVAVGLQSGAGSNNSVAIGSFAQTGAGQDYSVAVGSNVQTNGTQAVALGANAQANGNYALAVGNNGAQAIGDGSIAMGNAANVRAGSTNAIAIGTGANVARSVEGAMAFGANATAGAANSIALGANAFSDRANALSIGRAGAERQIVNVAAGTQATDAVNVSQLKGVTDSLGGGTTIGADGSITKPTYKVDGSDYHNVGDALDALASRSAGDPNAVAYDSAAKDTVTLGGAGATAPVALKNVADAKDDHDALNLGQLKDAGLVGQDGSGNLTSLAVTYDGTSKDKVSLAGADGTTLSNVKAGVADMDAVNVSQLKGSGLIGDDGKSIAAVTYDKNADGTPNYGSVTLGHGEGPTQLKNVADATDDGDALNLGQLKDAGLVGEDGAGKLTSAAVTYDKNADGTINHDTATLAGTNGTTLSNVKAGVADMDAVNVSQLKGSGLIGDDGKSIAAVTYDKNADGTPNYGSVTLGHGEGPTQLKNVADATDDGDALNLGQLKNAGLVGEDGTGKLTSAAVTYDRNADGTINHDTATLAGTDGTTLSNVKAGVADMDAVNVSQLKGSGLIGDDGKSIAAVTYDSAAKDSVTLGNAGTPVGIHNLAAGAVNATSNDAINGSQLFTVSKSVADKIGGGAGVGADGSITDPTYSVGGQDYHSVGDALGALDKNSGNNPLAVVYDGAAKDAVTLGGAGATTPVALKNVADAKDDGDALNLGQLKNAGLVGDDGTGNLTSAAMTYDKNADGTINHDKATLAGTDGTTLSNVKAGVADMDAVNVSQLKDAGLIDPSTGKSIAAVTYDSAAKDSVTLGGAGATTPVALKNVADGTDRHDAINLGQLQDAGLVTPVDPTDPGKGLTSLAVTYDGAAKDVATLAGTNGTTLSNVKAGVADMDAVNVSQLKDAGLIDPSTGKPIAAVTYDSAAKDSVTLGGAGATTPVALKNVADAKDDGDALNLGQLKNAGLVGDDGTGNLTSAAMTYDKNADGTINHEQATLAGTDGTTLSNVKAGVADMDAVNVSQLKDAGLIDPSTGKSIAAVTYDSAAKDSVTLGGAGATTPVALKNV